MSDEVSMNPVDLTLAFDHLVWSAPDLDEGVRAIAGLTGIKPIKSGSHSGKGTRNALLSLGKRSYLEIIAPDPAQAGGPWVDRLCSSPSVIHWAITVTDLEKMASTLPADLLGDSEIVSARRETPHGLLTWKLLFLRGHSFGGLVPFLIDWGSSPHPAEGTPQGCRLSGIYISCPQAKKLQAILNTLGLDLSVATDRHELNIIIDTPNGIKKLGSAATPPEGL